MGTVAILDAVGRLATTDTPIPVIYANSAAVYEENPNEPLTKPVQPQPISAYGVDKLAGELRSRVTTKVHSILTIALRFPNVYRVMLG